MSMESLTTIALIVPGFIFQLVAYLIKEYIPRSRRVFVDALCDGTRESGFRGENGSATWPIFGFTTQEGKKVRTHYEQDGYWKEGKTYRIYYDSKNPDKVTPVGVRYMIPKIAIFIVCMPIMSFIIICACGFVIGVIYYIIQFFLHLCGII